jgi:hypothetical protein
MVLGKRAPNRTEGTEMSQDAKTSAKGFDYAAKIGSLIAMAEDETLPKAARDSYRLKADQLMREYRIAEEETIAGDVFSLAPVSREIVLMESGAYDNPMSGHYQSLFRSIAKYAGVRFVVEYRWTDEPFSNLEESALMAVVYGYDMDIRIAEFYWTAARLVFMTRIDARPDATKSDQENCYYLRNSGLKRNDIAHALWGSAYNDGHAHGRVQKLYLAECATRGEEPRVAGRGIQVSLYREAYANSFVSEFNWRLTDAKNAADTAGGALELPGRAERVDEAFYTAYPKRRPMTEEQMAARQARWDAEEAAMGPCQACLKTTSKTGLCRRHRPSETTQADYRRWARADGPEARAGRANGAAAARSVDVVRTAGTRTQRTESAPTRPALGG